MKNKHLVLLFLSVLVLGVASRWLPMQYRTFFASNLLQVETEAVDRVLVSLPGKPDLLFDRIEDGWSVEQEGRTAVTPADTLLKILKTLAGIESFEVVKTAQPDTLGLASGDVLRVQIFRKNKLLENIEIGYERGDYTYLRLPEHNGIYRVPGRLRLAFWRTLDDFRSKLIVAIPSETLQAVGTTWPDSSSFFWTKNDSTNRWHAANGSHSISSDSVARWLALLHRLNNAPFADHFDESRESETLHATFTLEPYSGPPHTFRFFYLKPPDVPEDLTDLRRRGVRSLALFVLHTSDNPFNFFAITDTNLVHSLCRGLLPPETPGNTPRNQ